MANVEGCVSDDLQDYVPNTCTNSPAHGLAFCKEHCEIIISLGYPVELRQFLKSCAHDDEIDPDNYTKDMQKKVDQKLLEISKKIPASERFKSCMDAQGKSTHNHKLRLNRFSNNILGTGYLLRNRKLLTKNAVQLTGDGEDCNK